MLSSFFHMHLFVCGSAGALVEVRRRGAWTRFGAAPVGAAPGEDVLALLLARFAWRVGRLVIPVSVHLPVAQAEARGLISGEPIAATG